MADDVDPKGGATAGPGDDFFDAMRYGFQGVDMDAIREAMLGAFGGSKREMFRAMYMGEFAPPRRPDPEEELTEETAVPELDCLRQRFGDSRVLDTLVRALLEMGDIASVLMVARAELVSTAQRDTYRYEPRERMPRTDWRQRPESASDFRVVNVTADEIDISRDSYLDMMKWEPTGRKPAGKDPKRFTDFRDSKLGQTKHGRPK